MSDVVAPNQEQVAKIRTMFAEAFKEVMPVNLQSTRKWAIDYNKFSRSSRRVEVQTDTYDLFLRLPEYRRDDTYYYFKGTLDIYKTIVDTLVAEGVAQRADAQTRQDPLAGEAFWYEQPAPAKVIPLQLATADMDKVEAAIGKAADAVNHKIENAKKAHELLSKALGRVAYLEDPAQGPSPYLIAFEPAAELQWGGGLNLTRRSSAQVDILKQLEKENAIAKEWYGGTLIISVRDVEKLEAGLTRSIAPEIETGSHRRGR
ncbi:MAG: hypothetical protein KGJ06_06935 [Pseudomonadota bacterium]|nr:hypothetical protein [Pseudomonadota bacterium]